MSTYTDAHKRYYERHKKKILALQKLTKSDRDRDYYARNKKKIARRRKELREQHFREYLATIVEKADIALTENTPKKP